MTSLNARARLTGLAYLGMIPGAILGFLSIRPELVDPASAAATLAHVLAAPETARLAVLGSLSVVVAQALAAWGFYALFRERAPSAALGVAGFGGLLMVGGVFYVLAAFLSQVPAAKAAAELCAAPATIGEFWMIGALLVVGVKRSAATEAGSRPSTPTPRT